MSGISALAAASSDEAMNNITSMLSETGIKDISVTDGSNVNELVYKNEYTLVVFSLPFEKSFGLETVLSTGKSGCAVVVFVPSKVYDEVCNKLRHTLAVVVPKSSAGTIGVSAIKYALEQKKRADELRSENEMLRNMLNEVKLVNRAKCVLIEYLRISEKEAHRQIQKRAMDRRITLTEVAEDILKTYEYRS